MTAVQRIDKTLDAASARDRQAWSQMIEEETPSLRRYAMRLAATIDDANDLVQECALKALRARGQWRGDGPLRAWLFSIMRREFYRSTRYHARWRLVDLDALDQVQEPNAASAIDPLWRRKLIESFSALPAEQRWVLFAVGVNGKSYAEAAADLDVPIGTVMSRVSRARQKLRKTVASIDC